MGITPQGAKLFPGRRANFGESYPPNEIRDLAQRTCKIYFQINAFYPANRITLLMFSVRHSINSVEVVNSTSV
jgi:hypothetical protein